VVSVIVSFYERLGYLRACLDSLRLSDRDFDEVIIADDGSSSKTVEELRQLISRYDFPVHHVWHEKDGFRLAAARNNGIRAARGDYLIFLDCDFVVLPDTIRQHRLAARRGRYVAGLCKYLPEKETKELLQAPLSREVLVQTYGSQPERPLRREHRTFLSYVLRRKLWLVGPKKPQCSSHFSIHRADLEYVNGYDENFVGWGGEDEDLSTRMNMAGFQGHSVITTAKVLHLWHPKELGNRSWQAGANVAYLNRDHVPFRCENGLVKF